jgi:multiple sugar transport system permease protein
MTARILMRIGLSVGLLTSFGFPFVWMVISSLTDNRDLFAPGSAWRFLPEHWAWTNYVEIFRQIPLGRYLANGAAVAAIHSCLETLIAAAAAFVMVVIGGKRGRMLFWTLYLAWLIPGTFVLLPRFLVVASMPDFLPFGKFWAASREVGFGNDGIVVGSLLGLDSFFGMIVPGCFSATAAFLLAAAIRQVPGSLFEMAWLDTGSTWRAFRDACLPAIRAPLAVVAFLAFHGAWRSFTWPLLIASSPEMLTAPVGLMTFRDLHQAQWSLVMAGGVVMTLPSVALLLFAHRYVIDRAIVHEAGADAP